MENIKEFMDGLAHLISGLVTISTIIVRLTPTKADDKKLDEILKGLHKFMAYFPTVGRNPRTKELEKKEEPNIASA